MRHVLIRARDNEIKTQLRSTNVTSVTLNVVNPADGSQLNSFSATIDNPGVTLSGAAIRGAVDLLVSGPIQLGKYFLVGSDGAYEVILIQRYSNGIASLSNPLRSTYDTGAEIKSMYATVHWTPSQDVPDTVLFEWVIDNNVYTEDALVVNRKIQIPITGEELLDLYPRLRELLDTGNLGSQSELWVTTAWNDLYDTFWQQGKILDNVRSPSVLKAALLAQIRLSFARQGINLASSYEASLEDIKEAERTVNREVDRLVRSQNVWLDTDDDNRLDAGETLKTNIRLRW